MRRNGRTLGDDKLLDIARQVLTGEIDREKLAQPGTLSPSDRRGMLAYVGVALMLVTRHGLDEDNRVTGGLANILYDLVYRGTQAEIEEDARDYDQNTVYASYLQQSARAQGLHLPGERGQTLVLSPPPELQALVDELGVTPAVSQFMAAAVQGEQRAARERDPQQMQDRISGAIAGIEGTYGLEGVQELIAAAQRHLEEKK